MKCYLMSTLTIKKINPDYVGMDSYQFWEKIYLEYLTPIPICESCRETISKASDWLSFQCECSKYYHKQCVSKNFDALICPECHNCKQIYTFPKFLCKFMSKEEYYEVFWQSIKDQDSMLKLKLYQLWFQTYEIYTPPFLDLYDFLEPHNPYSTINFLESKKHNHRIECFDPAYVVEEDGMTYDTNRIEYFNKKVFVDLEKFRQRLQEFSYNLIDDTFPFSEHIVLAGGSVHKCLESRIDLSKLPKYSNMNIYLCHPELKIIIRDFKKIIKYFQDKHDKVYWVRKNINELRVYFPGYNRYIQISMYKNTLEEIIPKFDFSHNQFLYNGKKILATLSGVEYANYLVSVHNGYYDVYNFPKRFYKAKQLNLCMALPMAESLNIHLPKEIKIETWFPTYTDELDIVRQQMKSLYNIKNQHVTSGRPCRIFYTKIPTDFNFERHSFDQTPSEDDIINYIEQEMLISTR